jgi:hypothetical protein
VTAGALARLVLIGPRRRAAGAVVAREGRMQDRAPRLIDQVYEGMTVVDAAGTRLGKVGELFLGEPEANTVEWLERGKAIGDPPALRGIDVGDREPDVPEPLYSELRRVGYVKVDGGGLFGKDRYVLADRILAVDGDTMRVAEAITESDE